MCGRFTSTAPAEIGDALSDVFGEVAMPDDLPPRYNVAPTDLMPVLANKGERRMELFRWGLVPHWADSLAVGSKMINARAETLAEKPAYREAIAKRRCLVPADGFYEWRTEGKRKHPVWFHLEPRRVFCFAGLWAKWKPKDGGPTVSTFTIITTAPTPAIGASTTGRRSSWSRRTGSAGCTRSRCPSRRWPTSSCRRRSRWSPPRSRRWSTPSRTTRPHVSSRRLNPRSCSATAGRPRAAGRRSPPS